MIRMWVCATFLAGLLAGCGGGGSSSSSSPQPPAAVTIADFTPYLVQTLCLDANGAVLGLAVVPGRPCATTRPQRAADPIVEQKTDFGTTENGYVAEHSVLSDDGSYFDTAWQFGNCPASGPCDRVSFGPFDAAHGDGGEVEIVDPDGILRAPATQDGGTPGIQYFVGAAYGGTGWAVCPNTVPGGMWWSEVARLAIAAAPDATPSLGQAYTRCRHEPALPVLFSVAGTRTTLTLDCLVYEHWSGPSIAAATAVEQAAWCRDIGRVWWASYLPGAAPDIGWRVPALPWPAPPERPDLTLHDARLWTNIWPEDGTQQVDDLWPPAGFVPR